MGYEMLEYEENTASEFDGKTVDVETEEIFSVAQQGGAYVAISPVWGFYLSSYSTLGNSKADEEWVLGGETVLTNKVSVERQGLSMIAARKVRPNGYFLFGAQYDNTDFERFATNILPAAAAFGIDEDTVSTGTVSETVWGLNLIGGYEHTTFFTTNLKGWRHQLQGTIGLPLLTSVSNTEVDSGEAFRESFNGIQARLNSALGYQFHEKAIFSFGVDVGYSLRDAISVSTGDEADLPENVLFYIYPNVAINWSF
ncbi:MAG: hypothetical protein ACI835_004973 [Planctomycetota bacterium]|jgi:hypothetical protein